MSHHNILQMLNQKLKKKEKKQNNDENKRKKTIMKMIKHQRKVKINEQNIVNQNQQNSKDWRKNWLLRKQNKKMKMEIHQTMMHVSLEFLC